MDNEEGLWLRQITLGRDPGTRIELLLDYNIKKFKNILINTRHYDYSNFFYIF